MPKAIVVPVADVGKDSDKYLSSLMNSIVWQGLHEDNPCVIAFDGCREEFKEHFITTYPFIHPIINDGNRLKFAENANRGLRFAHKEFGIDCIVVNQDTVLPNKKYFDSIQGNGLVSPQQVTIYGTPKEGQPEVTKEELSKLNDIQPENFMDRSLHTKLVGFCLFINKEVMAKIGVFDNYFIESMEDDDISIRALLAGFTVETIETRVHHAISKSGTTYQDKLGIRLDQFRFKWSIPSNITHENYNRWIIENHTWIEEMYCG